MQRVSIQASDTEAYKVVDDDKGEFVYADEALSVEQNLQAVQATLAKMTEAHAALEQELATEKQARADDVAAVTATRDEYANVLDVIRLRVTEARPSDVTTLAGLVDEFVQKVAATRPYPGKTPADAAAR